ncbi:serine/threonine protein kinase [Actinomadura pelletieri DSM 43383]|uniref:Serine/threonine protein kinase n=1 Tax=Actinomadura pelletieri DSM 43383 TaxID=1120940 RepID=A0A495R026_9ACTN|nr:serine/threonine-protein kinase [Actinomadura pelletieri]RKS79677.1 serine/threonine protein kinase [Actinomadura pelletieri DSM 43383]
MESLDRSDPQRIGDRITLRGRLGFGGMGRVYYGVTDDHEQVAVKVIRGDLIDRDEVRERFARETEALRTVQGPHIASLVDASEADEEQPWLAMEFIRGLTLKKFVNERGPLQAEYAAALGVLLADALRDVHAAGLLHRDLKPGNVILGRDGPMVIDLGLVAFAEGPSDLTTSAATLGTLVCMAPEQALTPKRITAAADVHALGATLLHALTGHYPYRADTAPALLAKIVSPDVPPDVTGLPDAFADPVTAMLAYDPRHRPTVEQARTRFEELCGPVPAAVRSLTMATYVERESDPEDVPPPPRTRVDLSQVAPPGSVVARLADRLRAAYAVTAPF